MTDAVRSNSAQAAPATDPPLLDCVLFYILLAVLSARPLIGETFEHLRISFLTALQAPQGATPATTAWLDSLLLAASALALARDGRWRRSRLVAVGVGLLAVAVGLSTAVAGDKPAALLAGCSLVIFVLAGAALVCLVRTRWMFNLLLVGLLATGATTAIKCLNQRWYENPLTQQRWECVYKPELIRQGFDPQDPVFINFERRMRAGETYGFLGHPNVTATCLLMCLLAAGGLLAAGVVHVVRTLRLRAAAPRSWGALGASALLCALLATALPLTGSRGALLAAGLGVVLLLFLGLTARWSARHARGLLPLLIAGYVAVVAAGTAYGLKHDTLPNASLAFRWHYWTAAWRAWQDVPLTGLGRENFAAAYQQYKRPQSPEEVRNPHNLWISLLVELGPLGLVAGVLLCAASVLAGLRGLAGIGGACPRDDPLTAARAVPVAIGVLAIQAAFSGTPFSEPGMLLVWGQEIVLPWGLALLSCVWVLNRLDGGSHFVHWLGAGLCAALGGTLVHSLIDFTLLTPAGLGLYVLCAVGAVRIGRCSELAPVSPRAARGTARALALAAVVGVIGLYVVFVTRPAAANAQALEILEGAVHAPPPRGGPEAVRVAASRIMRSGTLDAAVARAAARAMLQVSRAPQLGTSEQIAYLNEARACASATCASNPRDASSYVLMAAIDEELGQVHASVGEVDKAAQDRLRAAENWQRAVDRYPTNPRSRLSAGEAWLTVWQWAKEDDAARLAAEDFRAALSIDDSRPAEEVMRLRPLERRRAAEGLALLQIASAPSPRPERDGG
jgi:hypothetical protein